MNSDNNILNKAFSLYINHPSLQAAFLAFANDIAYLFVLFGLIYWFARKNRTAMRAGLLEALISLVVARLILTELIRYFLPRARPTVADGLPFFTTAKAHEASFPSGHASAMFAIAMSIYFYDKKLGWILFGLSLITGIFRVIVGYHFPSDIVGGLALGVIVSAVIHATLSGRIALWAQKISDFSDRLLPFTKQA
jgi:undecaprenyl-diphosphatase